MSFYLKFITFLVDFPHEKPSFKHVTLTYISFYEKSYLQPAICRTRVKKCKTTCSGNVRKMSKEFADNLSCS